MAPATRTRLLGLMTTVLVLVSVTGVAQGELSGINMMNDMHNWVPSTPASLLSIHGAAPLVPHHTLSPLAVVDHPATCTSCVSLGGACSVSNCCSNGTVCVGGECRNVVQRAIGEVCDFQAQQLGLEVCVTADTKLACLRGTCKRYEQPRTCRCKQGDERYCASIESCSTGFCHSTKLRWGEACSTNSQCQSGECLVDASGSTPAPTPTGTGTDGSAAAASFAAGTCATPINCLADHGDCPPSQICDLRSSGCVAPYVLGATCTSTDHYLCPGAARCSIPSPTASLSTEGTCAQFATKKLGESCAVIGNLGAMPSDAMCRDRGAVCDRTTMVCQTVGTCQVGEQRRRECDGRDVCTPVRQCGSEADALYDCENNQCKTVQGDPFLEECRTGTCASQFAAWVCCSTEALGLKVNEDGYTMFGSSVVGCAGDSKITCPFDCCQRDVECPLSCLPAPPPEERDEGDVVVEFEPAVDADAMATTASTAAGATVGAAVGGSVAGSVGGASGAGAATSAAGGMMILQKLQFFSVTAQIGSKLNDSVLPEAYTKFADSFKWTLFQVTSPVEDGVEEVSRAFASFAFWWYLVSAMLVAFHATIWLALGAKAKLQRMIHSILLKVEYFWIEYTHLSTAQLSIDQLSTFGISVPIYVSAVLLLVLAVVWPAIVAWLLWKGIRPELYDPFLRVWDDAPVHDPSYARIQPLIAHFTLEGRWFSLWRIVKNMIFGVVIGMLGSVPLAQSYLLYVTCLCDVCALLYLKPYTSRLLGKVELAGSTLQLIAAVLITHFTAESDPRNDNVVAQLLMTCNLIGAALAIVINWYFLGLVIAKRYRKKQLKRRKQKEINELRAEGDDNQELETFLKEMPQAKVDLFAQADRDRRVFAMYMLYGKQAAEEAANKGDDDGAVEGEGSDAEQAGDDDKERRASDDDKHAVKGASQDGSVDDPESAKNEHDLESADRRVRTPDPHDAVTGAIRASDLSPNTTLIRTARHGHLSRESLKVMERVARKAKRESLARSSGAASAPGSPAITRARPTGDDDVDRIVKPRRDSHDSDSLNGSDDESIPGGDMMSPTDKVQQSPLMRTSIGGLGSNHWGSRVSSPGLQRRKKILDSDSLGQSLPVPAPPALVEKRQPLNRTVTPAFSLSRTKPSVPPPTLQRKDTLGMEDEDGTKDK